MTISEVVFTQEKLNAITNNLIVYIVIFFKYILFYRQYYLVIN